MTKATRNPAGSRLLRCAAISLIILIALVLLDRPVLADSDGGAQGAKARISSDLLEKIRKESPANVVRVVVQVKDGAGAEVADLVEHSGGVVRGHFRRVGQMVVELPLEEVEHLAELDGVEYVTPDRPVSGVASHIELATGANLVYPTLLASGYNGTGVTVAVIDSGVDPDHFDLRDDAKGTRRVLLSIDFTGSGVIDDPYGHGTHVAGIIAGDGSSGLTAGRDYTGIAPAANLVNLRVLDAKGRGSISTVIAAIDKTISIASYYNIRVINLSLASPPLDSYVNDPLCKAVDRATKAGLVVVTAAGNFGLDSYGREVYGGIASPGISPEAITVGALDTRQTNARSDDRIAPYSSRGPTRSHSTDPLTGAVTYDNLAKPDLVAPGLRVVSLERYSNAIVTAFPFLHVDTGWNVNNKSRYMMLTGTSMSSGVVSGTVALMLQANPGLTPNMVKAILLYSAQMMDGPDLFEQGAGMLNVDGAVRLARSLSPYGYALPVGSTLSAGLPAPQSTIAGETFAWNQGLVWSGGWVSGQAMFTQQQAAYARSLVWGLDATSWGTGVTYGSGLFADGYVVFAKTGQWSFVVWDEGTLTGSGLLYKNAITASGALWQNQQISSDFFNLGSSSLIWGFDSSLIWGFGSSLIWGFDSSLIWGVY